LVQACQRFPYLENFVQDWPTKELAKSRLKNRRAYCRKKGYDTTDFGMIASSPPHMGGDDSNDEEDEEPGNVGAGSGEEDEDDNASNDGNGSD
jgi:hypothetical protein